MGNGDQFPWLGREWVEVGEGKKETIVIVGFVQIRK